MTATSEPANLRDRFDESIALAEQFFGEGFNQAREFTESEAALASLLLPAAEIPVPHWMFFVDVIDPNGDGSVGEFWSPPRVLGNTSRGGGCGIELDVATTPVVAGGYVEGDPSAPPSPPAEASIELFEASASLGITIVVLDNAEQRDQLVDGHLAFLAAMSAGVCTFVSFSETFGLEDDEFDVRTDLGGELFPDVSTFEPADVGYPAWGINLEGGMSGDGERRIYAVGDRLYVDLSYGSTFLNRSDEDPALSPDELDVVARRLIDHLVESGFG